MCPCHRAIINLSNPMTYTATSSLSTPHPHSVSNTEQAYRILHLGFTVAPILAGFDKFFNILTDWSQYVPSFISSMLPMSLGVFLAIVGIIEMAAGLLVATRPKVGAYVVAAWLGLIIVNLLILQSFYDVALRDLGLMLGALALARLSADR